MLRSSNVNPLISAHDIVFGPLDYNRHPLVPLGYKAVIHEKPAQRASWDPHGVAGYYIGPELEHYQCARVYIPATRSERVSDSVSFHLAHVKMPEHAPAQDIC